VTLARATGNPFGVPRASEKRKKRFWASNSSDYRPITFPPPFAGTRGKFSRREFPACAQDCRARGALGCRGCLDGGANFQGRAARSQPLPADLDTPAGRPVRREIGSSRLPRIESRACRVSSRESSLRAIVRARSPPTPLFLSLSFSLFLSLSLPFSFSLSLSSSFPLVLSSSRLSELNRPPRHTRAMPHDLHHGPPLTDKGPFVTLAASFLIFLPPLAMSVGLSSSGALPPSSLSFSLSSPRRLVVMLVAVQLVVVRSACRCDTGLRLERKR